MKRTILMMICLLCAAVFSFAGEKPVVLLVFDDGYGANYNIDDETESIRELLASLDLETVTASYAGRVAPCEYGRGVKGPVPFKTELRTKQLRKHAFDAVMIMPGSSHAGLMKDSRFHEFLRDFAATGKPLAAWCSAVRVLAAADVINGVTVIGAQEYNGEYRAAGALPVVIDEKKDAPPPVLSGNIITTVRSRFYRSDMCELLERVVEKRRPDVAETGIFRAYTSFGAGYFSSGAGFADTDGDGWPDLMVSNGLDSYPQKNTVFMNKLGEFGPEPDIVFPLADTSGNIALGDTDNDGDEDLLVTFIGRSAESFAPGQHKFYENDGSFASPDWVSEPGNAFSASFGDVDDDGDLDMAVVQGANSLKKEDIKYQPIVIYENNGGRFGEHPVWQSEGLYNGKDIELADMDMDGDLDLIASGRDMGVEVYLNDGGVYPPRPSWKTGAIVGARQMDMGDVNGDGYPDLAVAGVGNNRFSGGSFYLFLNDNGMFRKEPVWSCDLYEEPSCVAWCDVDCDGDQDLIAGGWIAHAGVFENKDGVLGGEYADAFFGDGRRTMPQQIALADTDRDGIVTSAEVFHIDSPVKSLKIESLSPISVISVFRNGRKMERSEYCVDKANNRMTFVTRPAPGETITVAYEYSLDIDIIVTSLYDIKYFKNSGGLRISPR